MNSKIFLAAVLATFAGGSAWAEGYVNSLPLKITSVDQLYSTSTSGSGSAVTVEAENVLNITKTSGTNTNTGDVQAVVKFDGIPGFATLTLKDNSAACARTSGDHNYILISESADGVTFSNEQKYATHSDYTVTLALAKDTRYIKFQLVITKNKMLLTSGSYCGHGFNPLRIDLPKSVDIQEEAVSFSGKQGNAYKDTISVSYSNPVGNLACELSNTAFTLRKLTTDDEAAKAGTAQYEISYPGEEVSEAEATLKVYDSAYTDAYEAIPLKASIVADLAPDAPSVPTTSAVSYTSTTLTWDAVADAVAYKVTLTPASQTRAAAESQEFTVTEPTITFNDLTVATNYEATVCAVSETGKVSEATSFSFSTKAVNAPTGLSVQASLTSLTATWTAVEDITGYVVTLLANGEEVASEKLGADILTYTFEGLTKGTNYTVNLVAVDGEYSSTALATATATRADFGPQLANSGFENWEKVSVGYEPNNWNSFATAGGTYASFSKAEQVKQSDNIRPNTTGSSSANIYSRSVMSVVANGNLTTGKINAGGLSASSTSNYNAVDPTDANFYQVIDQIPDSVTVWVKNVPVSGTGKARLAFYLHGEGIVKDPESEVSELTVATATYNYDECDWTRLAVPFELVHKDVTPRYMLATFSTNMTAGGGTAGDNVYIDDLVLVYNPTLKVETLAKTAFNEGDSFTLPYSLTGSMSVSNLNAPANTVYAELSDRDGNFDNAVRVSEVITTDESGELAITLPTDIETSESYRIRVVTTNYPMTAVAEESLAIEGTKSGTALESVVASAQSRVYPNPAKDVIYLTNAEGAAITVRSLAGATVKVAAAYTNGISVADLAQGVYFIEVRKEGVAQTLKFVKE